MNYGDIVTLAESVGLNADRARVAAAIAMAESSGNPSKINNNPATGDDSYGLWQINFYGPLISRLAQYGLPDKATVLDPRRNAMVMAHISSNGGNFNAWTTYTNGEYKKYLDGQSLTDKAAQAIQGLKDGAGNVVSNTEAIGQAAANFVSLTQKSAAWISNSKNWVRVAYITGGGIVVLIAIDRLIKSAGSSASIIPKHLTPSRISKHVQTVAKGANNAS